MNMNEQTGADMGQATAEPAAAAEPSVLITAKADGSFELQAMQEGQPFGDPIPAASIDEAMQAAQDALGGAPAAEEAPAEESTETPTKEAAEPSAEQMAEEDKNYASKSGTRPKTKPSFDDYMSPPPSSKR